MKINILGVEYKAKRGTNFGPRISPEDAACILRHAYKIGKSHLVSIRCKEYGQDDSESDEDAVEDGMASDPKAWAQVYFEDWWNGDEADYDDGGWADNCRTFEVEAGHE